MSEACKVGLKPGIVGKETFEREVALCKDLKATNGDGCGWGKCDQCGVLPLLVKLHEGKLVENSVEINELRTKYLG
jgi:hypothetical protein